MKHIIFSLLLVLAAFAVAVMILNQTHPVTIFDWIVGMGLMMPMVVMLALVFGFAPTP